MKARVKKLERITAKGKNTEIPIFLDVEGDNILFTDGLLRSIGIDPEEYPIYPGQLMDTDAQGREVPKDAHFISHYTGEAWANNCYLHLKGYEEKRIILFYWENGDTGD